MKPVLIRTEGPYPPGSFIFRDPITNKNYTDTHTGFDERVKQIIKDRQANMRLIRDATRLGYDTVATELSEQICERLNYNSKFCTGDAVVSPSDMNGTPITRPGMTCTRCGATQIEELICPTCSGRRVIGWKCKICKHEMHR